MAEITLNVRMLGGFSITYDGREVVLGRNKSAKFIKVLQIVWLAGDRGISKGQLVSRIYSDQELLTNLSNSLNNLFYQMRKQMVKSGLPDYEYVVKKDSMFMIDEKTEIITDVGLFIDFCSKGDRASDTEEKLANYIKAFDIYIGELLPENASEVQVITDSTLLHKRYSKVVQWLGDYYKEQKNYPQMYRIYEKAARIYPADDWQAGQIDSLVCREMYKDAYDLYDKTVRYYKEELGIQPTERLAECYNRMNDHLSSGDRRLSDIQEEIVTLRSDRKGAYYCSYPGFVDCYHLLCRTMERSGQSIYLMLCTLTDYNGKPIANRDKLKLRSDELQEVIKYSLRYGDAFCKYSDSQYLILLTGLPYEAADIVSSRIVKRLKETIGYKVTINCSAASIAELPEQK